MYRNLVEIASKVWTWIVRHRITLGICSLVWLILRSGTQPRRLAYPCQQVAAVNVTAIVGGLLAALFLAESPRCAKSRARVSAWRRRMALCAVMFVVAMIGVEGIPYAQYLAGGGFESQTKGNPAPERTLAGSPTTVSIVREAPQNGGYTDLQIENMVREAVNLTGGLDGIIVSGDQVVIKPNLVVPGYGPGSGVVTDVRVVAAVVKLAFEAGAGEVIIAEGTASSFDGYGPRGITWTAYHDAGFDTNSDGLFDADPSVTLVDLNDTGGTDQIDPSKVTLVQIPNGVIRTDYYVPNVLLDCDVLINVPVLKNHFNGTVTLSLKNRVGCAPNDIYHLPGSPNLKWALVHTAGQAFPATVGAQPANENEVVRRTAVDLNLVRPQDFVVVDGLVGMTNGPVATSPKHPDPHMHLIAAGADSLALDTVGSLIMGYDPDQIDQLTWADSTGVLGTMDRALITVAGDSVSSVRSDFPENYADSQRADTSHPYLTDISLVNGQAVSGIVNVQALGAGDNGGLIKAELYVNGELVAVDRDVPVGQIEWNTAGLAVGNHTVEMVVYDDALNEDRITRTVMAGEASTGALTNGDFSTWDESGWTRYTSPGSANHQWSITSNGPTPAEATAGYASNGSGGNVGWYQIVEVTAGADATLAADWSGDIQHPGWAELMVFSVAADTDANTILGIIDTPDPTDIAFKKDTFGPMNPPTTWGWEDAALSPMTGGNGGTVTSQGWVVVALKVGGGANLANTCSWDNMTLTVSGEELPPVIVEHTPDPDSALVGTEYVRQLGLAQGTAPVSWSVLQGPTGLNVDSSGLVSGWTPAPADDGQSFTIEIEASNTAGTDTETWIVDVTDDVPPSNLLVNGDLGTADETAWTRWNSAGASGAVWSITSVGPTAPEMTADFPGGTGGASNMGWYQAVSVSAGTEVEVDADWAGMLRDSCSWAEVMLFTVTPGTSDNDIVQRIDVGNAADIAFKKDGWGLNPPMSWGWEKASLSPTTGGNGGSVISDGVIVVATKLGGQCGGGNIYCRWDNLTLTALTGDVAPVIAEVTPDPDSATEGAVYNRQLTLVQGSTPITWSVVQGPAGVQVDSSGYVSGWVPSSSDVGQSVTLEIQAANTEGSDTETWQVVVEAAGPANLLTNGDFADTENGWTRYQNSWSSGQTWAITSDGPTAPEAAGSYPSGGGNMGWYQAVPVENGASVSLAADWAGSIQHPAWAEIMLFPIAPGASHNDILNVIDGGNADDIAFKKDTYDPLNPPTTWDWQDASLSPMPGGNGGTVTSAGWVVVALKVGGQTGGLWCSWDNLVLTLDNPPGDPPVITQQPASQTVCVNQSVSFTVSATGALPLQYQWRKDGSDIPGAQNATYQIGTVAEADAGSYDCVVTNTDGSATSSAATLTVDTPPIITQQPVGGTYCLGEPFMLSVTAEGTDLHYQWRRDGIVLAFAHNATYEVPAATTDHAGAYDCVVSNDCGEVISNLAVVTLENGPAITQQPAGTDVCEGQGFTLSVVADGTPELTYQWRRNTAPISGATSASYAVASAVAGDAGDYDCVVTNGCGNVTSSTATVVVKVGPTITQQPADADVCDGQGFSLSVTADGSPTLAYQWRQDGTPIDGATSSSYDVSSASGDDVGGYDCVVSNDCGSVTSEVASVTVNPGPTITQQPVGADVCEGQGFMLTIAVDGPIDMTYQWRKDGTPIDGATSAGYDVASAATEDAGSYDCVLSAACGSLTSSVAVVTVASAPTITQQPADADVTEGDTADFAVMAEGSSPLSYQWQQNDGSGWGDILGADAADYSLVAALSDDGLQLRCVVTNTCGSVTSDPAVLTVTPNDTQGPVMLAAVSRKAHGSAGEMDLDLLNPFGSYEVTVEPRANGLTKLVVTFDEPITGVGGLDASDIQLSGPAANNATITSVSAAGEILTVELTGTANGYRMSLGFPGITDTLGNLATASLELGLLEADVTGDGSVNIFDLLGVRAGLSSPVDSGSFLRDVDVTGAVNIFDLLFVRARLSNSIVVVTELLDEDFEAYADGADPLGWFDTASHNSMTQDDLLFGVLTLADGNKVLGTNSPAVNIHSHYVANGSAGWTNYELNGRIMINNASGAIGFTLFSDYPNSDNYYRLRSLGGGSLHIDPHGTAMTGGTTDSGVIPVPDIWYRVRIQAMDTGVRTEIKAKAWVEGDPEPVSWQIDCYDDSPTRRSAGAMGVWSYASGSKYWDNLRVTSLD